MLLYKIRNIDRHSQTKAYQPRHTHFTAQQPLPSTLTSTKPKEDPAGFDASRKYLPSSVRLFDGTLTTSLVMVRLMMESAKIENEKSDCCVLLVTLVIFSPPLGVVANNELE